jgi:hypothetical protein
MLKGIITREDWRAIRQKVFYSFLKDTYYTELKMLEIIQQRVSAVDRFVNYAGKLVSWEWVRRNLLMQTDDEMKQLDAQMLKEKSDPRYQALEAMTGAMGGGMMGGDMGGGMGGDMGGGDPGGAGGGEGAEGGGDDEDEQPQQMPPDMASQAQQMGADDEQESPLGTQLAAQAGSGDDEDIDPDDLPTEKVTRNVEALWRR